MINPSHVAIRITVNATAAGFIYKKKRIPTPIIKNKTDDILQIYLYQNVCK